MPIVVAHEPNPAALGRASFLAGRGEYRQRQEQINLETALKLMQMRQAAQEDAARLHLAERQQNLGEAETQQRLGIAQQELENRQKLGQQKIQAQSQTQQGIADRADLLFARQQEVAKQKFEQQQQLKDPAGAAWGTPEGVQALNDQIAAIEKRATEDQQSGRLTRDGQIAWNRLQGKLKAVRDMARTLRPPPRVMSAALRDFLKHVEDENLDKYLIEPPKIGDIVQQQTAPVMENGQAVPGQFWVWDQKTGKVSLEKAGGTTAGAKPDAERIHVDAENKTYDKDYAAAHKRLTDQATASAGKDKDGKRIAPAKIEPKAILEEMHRYRAERATEVAQHPGPQAKVDNVSTNQQPAPARQVNATYTPADEPAAQRQPAGGPPVPGEVDPGLQQQPQQPAAPQYTDEDVVKIAKANGMDVWEAAKKLGVPEPIAKPTTEQEFNKLDRGRLFVHRDGTVRRKP